MDKNRYCVIMAGGAGSRLWPMSTQACPKQFLRPDGNGKSFLQLTYERFCTIVPPENIIVVTAHNYASMVKEHLKDLPQENLLLEPYSRNTAPCIAYATYSILKRNPDAVVAVTPSDHIIVDEGSFRANVVSALEFASHNDVLVTIGVTPTRPDPNYGYIQAKGGKDASKEGEALKVKTFTEKPPVEIARVFINSGEFLWNSGIFAWKASVIKKEMDEHMKEMCGWFSGWEDAVGTPHEAAFIEKAYAGCERTSIDFGVMEKTSSAWVYPATFGWWDIGSWNSIYNYVDKDSDDNAVHCSHKLLKDVNDCILVERTSDKLVAISGLENYMVVDTKDVLLICPRDDARYGKLLSLLAVTDNENFR